jgi:hypothetical protein
LSKKEKKAAGLEKHKNYKGNGSDEKRTQKSFASSQHAKAKK